MVHPSERFWLQVDASKTLIQVCWRCCWIMCCFRFWEFGSGSVSAYSARSPSISCTNRLQMEASVFLSNQVLHLHSFKCLSWEWMRKPLRKLAILNNNHCLFPFNFNLIFFFLFLFSFLSIFLVLLFLFPFLCIFLFLFPSILVPSFFPLDFFLFLFK